MDLEQRLAAAQARMDAARAAMRGKHAADTWTELDAASAELLEAERALAAARNEEHAVPLAFPVAWDFGAPMPHVVMNDHKLFLIFLVRTPDPASDAAESLALVEFTRCASAKLGGPNDEVFHGHPLHGKGLDGYTAQLVKNSRWRAELERVNSVHSGYRPEHWLELNHYVLWFHDSTFECLARSFTVEQHQCSISALLAEACRRLVA